MNEDSILIEALQKASPAQRAAFLDTACAGNAELRRSVELLLRAHEQAGAFLHGVPATETTGDATAAEGPGMMLGPYKLLQQIGEGGMGTVFMAEQEQPVRRRVALKIIKPGMDSRQVIARFEAERQALAMMDHQNIARVLDAGTTESGRPYFVMELVHGVPITQFCDERMLTPRERLELFVPVCQAIHHAHQKGIIHRDIKPSNVLVTMYDDKPVPKVIDFGVAKAVEQRLTEKTMFTQFGTLVGTFEYMSPEQAEMNAFGVDTRSDIYSLGVMLYELLTGTTPLEKKRLREAAFSEMVRLIKEEEALRPSLRLSSSNDLRKIAAARKTEPARLSGLVRGEVDWIVMKCLEKDRTRRYESANGLARDIQRHLADEPVEACPPSAGYRLRKFAGKYRTPLRFAGAFLLLLVLGVIVSMWQAIRATLAEHHASEQAGIAHQNELEALQAREETRHEHDQVVAVNQKLEATLAHSRRTLYVSDINRAYKFWDEGNVQRAEELLERHRPRSGEEDLRGVEWYYLWRLCARFQRGRLLDTKTAIVDLAVSADGKSLATVCANGVALWDAATGAMRFNLPHSSVASAMTYVAFSADSRTLVLASGSRTPQRAPRSARVAVQFWDVATGTKSSAAAVKLEVGELGQVQLSPDGAVLIGFKDEANLRLWSTRTGQSLVTLNALAADPSITPAYMHRMALAPDGKTLVWQLGPTTMVWDLPSRKLQFKHFQSRYWAFAVALSPDGKLLACHRGGPPHVVQLWDWKAHKKLAELPGFEGHVYFLTFSPDGKLLAAGDEFATIRVWEVATHKEVATLKGHAGHLSALVFAPDGRWLYSAGLDGVVRRWRPVPGPDPDTIEGDVRLFPVGLGFSANGQTLFTAAIPKAAEDRLELNHWDLAGRQRIQFQAAHRFGLVSPDGGYALLGKRGGRNFELWDVRASRKLAQLEGQDWFSAKTVFSPNSRTLALSEPTQIGLWDTQTGKARRPIKATEPTRVTFSADSKLFAATTGSAAAGHSKVTMWETATLTPVAEFAGPASVVAFTPDGRGLATLHADVVTLWDIRAQRVQTRFKLFQPIAADLVPYWRRAFSPDGKLFSAAEGSSVHIWDTSSGERLATLTGRRTSVSTVAWSPDGKTLATASGPIIKLWNVATGEELTTFVAKNRVYFLAFAPDGSLAVADGLNSVRLWRTQFDKNEEMPGE